MSRWDLVDKKNKYAEIIPIVNPLKYINNFCLYTPRDVLKQARADIQRLQIKINDIKFKTSKDFTTYLTNQKIPLTISTWMLQMCTQAAFAYPLEVTQDRFQDSIVGHHEPTSNHYKPVRIRGNVTPSHFEMQLAKKMRAFYVNDEGSAVTTHHITIVIDVRGTQTDVDDAWITLHVEKL